MRVRHGFVSNSSSTAFIVTNLTDEKLTLVDFVQENPQLIKEFVDYYDWYNKDEYNQENLLASAKANNEDIGPGSNYMIFGDEDGTMIGNVFDYILRDGGSSKRFAWYKKEMLR